ncbi:Mov34/MPN/PAD-1 family protein [Salibacter halophilus]|uniref:Mov34/MPN/PAD-1 family protein n=1 Tax=Salibacter halophilus TaxID=1803916 RepID=UPI00147980E7|nr:Mov34/MPN/PAD-1 family protein [Salibacter halophilus]
MRIFKYKKTKLIITNNVQQILENHIQDKSAKNEAGGILLGQVIGNEFYLTKATEPNDLDKATRYSFERNKENAQIVVDYEYVNSNKRTIYLGEWHTHPEKIPSPSKRDIKMIKSQFKLGENLAAVIFLLIQGQNEFYVGICNGKKIRKMEEV